MNEEQKKRSFNLYRKQKEIEAEIMAVKSQMGAVKEARYITDKFNANKYQTTFLDSRGRIYYHDAYLQPQSSDLVKGLLTMDNPKPLTLRGYLWLIWHIATVYGFDKADFNGRIEWTLEQLQNGELDKVITDQDNSQLVKDADQPSLFIQAVSVFLKANDSGDPTNYVCSIEIGMDATSSGIQFLSAIALDAEGGKKVNLITNPDQKAKADIYKAGVDKAMVNILSYNNILSKWLTLHPITRTMAKRPIMTLPYSASENSAAEYVEDELGDYPLPIDSKERDDMRIALNSVLGFRLEAGMEVNTITGEVEVTDFNLKKKLARFIARELRTACAIEIPAAMKLLEFFKGLPKLLQKDIDWYTPDDLYVVNKYRSVQKIRTCLHETTEYGLILEFDVISDNTNYIDAGNGLSPNFIHSLDATLVREVARRCDFKAIFIHDQFLCHPADADTMFQTIKESFVDIIKSDPLGKLLEQHGLTHMEADLKVNTLDLNKVLESEFIVC